MNYTVRLQDYWSKINLSESSEDIILPGGLASAYDHSNNIVYIYGGCDYNGGVYNKLIVHDLNSNNIYNYDSLDIPDRINHSMHLISNNRLCIIGGSLINETSQPLTIKIYIYNINTKKIEEFDTKIPNGVQIRTTLKSDKDREILYLYESNNNNHYSINLKTFEKEKLKSFTDYSLNGALYTLLPNNKIFIFSGFSENKKDFICHNSYYLYDINKQTATKTELSEPFGRTFSKSIILENLNKVIIFGGTHNGMEASGCFYFYDYISNDFNIIYLDPLPGGRCEPTMIYSNIENKIYIYGGLVTSGSRGYSLLNEVMVLDLAKTNEFKAKEELYVES